MRLPARPSPDNAQSHHVDHRRDRRAPRCARRCDGVDVAHGLGAPGSSRHRPLGCHRHRGPCPPEGPAARPPTDLRALLADVRRERRARADAPVLPARPARPAAQVVDRPQELYRVSARVLQRDALSEHRRGGDVRDRGCDGRRPLAEAPRRRDAVLACDRCPPSGGGLEGRYRDCARPHHGTDAVAPRGRRGGGVVSRHRGRDRLLRVARPASVRRAREHRPRALGIRHGRPHQRQPVGLRRTRLHHDLRRLDPLRPPAHRSRDLDDLRQARRPPLRELLRESLDGRAPDLLGCALGEGGRARRGERARGVDESRRRTRVHDAGRRRRRRLRRRPRRKPARLLRSLRRRALAEPRCGAHPRSARRHRHERLLLHEGRPDVCSPHVGRQDRLAASVRTLLGRYRDEADVLLHAERPPARLRGPRRGAARGAQPRVG